MSVRLDQFVASCTELSRKDAKRAIGKGAVAVDGEPCRIANRKVDEDAHVTLNGKALSLPGERYLMMNKPEGVVSATTDSEHPTALDLLPPALSRNLHIAGRLDIDTTGLLILTTDGQWSHRITSPRTGCPKTYRVTLSTPLAADAEQALTNGVHLRNEDKPTLPAEIRRLEGRLIELTLSEGRYHQVKRMIASVGNHVTALHRTRVGAIHLDPTLMPGEFRHLTAEEIASVGQL